MTTFVKCKSCGITIKRNIESYIKLVRIDRIDKDRTGTVIDYFCIKCGEKT